MLIHAGGGGDDLEHGAGRELTGQGQVPFLIGGIGLRDGKNFAGGGTHGDKHGLGVRAEIHGLLRGALDVVINTHADGGRRGGVVEFDVAE